MIIALKMISLGAGADMLPSAVRPFLIPLLALTLISLVVLVRRLLSPISRLPGPFLTKISFIPIFAYDHYSQRTSWIRSLHARYGPVVRVSPDEVSVVSATGIRDIFSGASGSGPGGAFPKDKVFELFKHFGARNSFTSITAAQHGWRRKVIGASYTQSAVLTREASTGNIWRAAGDYLAYVEDSGIVLAGDEEKKEEVRSVDIYTANSFYAAEGVTSYVLLNGLKALRGDARHRRLVIATQEKPADRLSYLHTEHREFFNWLNGIKATARRFIPGLAPQVVSERTRNGDKDPKKLNSPFYGGTEYRDFGYRGFLEAKEALAANPDAWTKGPPITVKLASNVLTGDAAETKKTPAVEDPSMRGFQGEGNYLKDAGAASEVMDHLVAGQDTTSETLSHLFQALSMPENQDIQDKLCEEIRSLDLPQNSHDVALTPEQLGKVVKAPYLDAVVKEVLRLYPPHTTNIHRVVPEGGRVLDGFYIPQETKVGTSAYIVALNDDIFGSDVERFVPGRWLVDDVNKAKLMDYTMWAFGSGPRGCVGKHLATVEMKLLVCAVYGRYTTREDKENCVSAESNHFRHRSTNRDYYYFPKASGRIAFIPNA